MSQNDKIGNAAGCCLICVVIAVLVGGTALLQLQDALDEIHAQQQSLACFQAPRMCVEPEK